MKVNVKQGEKFTQKRNEAYKELAKNKGALKGRPIKKEA